MGLIQKYEHIPRPAKASLWFLICSFLQKGISVITTPIFTRLLSTSEYGEYSVFESWLSIITIFVTLNMCSGVYLQGLVKFDKERKVFSSAVQGLNLVLVIGWTVIYTCSMSFWNKLFGLSTVQMYSMLLMIWTSSVFNFWAAEQRVNYNYKLLVGITLIVSLLKPIVGIIFVINSHDKVTARIIGLALVELLVYTAFFFIQEREGKVFFSKKHWLYVLSFAIPLIPHYLSQIVLSSADRIMIKNMVGDSEAGIYSLAYSVSRMMVLFNTSLLSTMSPWIYQKIKSKKIADICNVVYSAFLGVAFVNIILIIFAPEAIKIFAPKAYYEAIWTIPPVALSCIFTFAYNIFSAFEFYYKKSLWISSASIIGALLNIVLNYICIKAFGYIAAGYTTLTCYVIYAIMHYSFMIKVCDEELSGERPYNTKLLILGSVGIVIVGLLFNFTYDYPIIRYGLSIIAVAILFFERKRISRYLKLLLSIRNRKQ